MKTCSWIRRSLAATTAALAMMAATIAIAAPSYEHEGPILISNASMIDGLDNLPNRMRDILIVDGRIQQISARGFIGDLPEGTKVIDATGMTAMPGIMDLHVHFGNYSMDWEVYRGWDEDNIQQTLNAFLYAGVTTVLDIGNDHDNIVRLRDQVAAGTRLGPRIVATGRTVGRLESVTGTGNMPSEEVQTEIRELLDKRQNAGMELVKIYGGVTPWGARHLVKQAHDRGMRVVADFWCNNLSRTVFETTGLDAYAHGGCRESTQEEAEWIANNGKFVIMTLAAFDIMGGHLAYSDYEGNQTYYKNDLIVGPWGKQMSKDYYDTFSEKRNTIYEGEHSFFQSNLFGDMTNMLGDGQKTVKKLSDADALIGLGTDSNWPPGTFPGDSLHHEMLLHVQAGIDPVRVIHHATLGAARILKIDDETGSIERGKFADIMIVRGDPSKDINDTRNIEYIIKGGKLIDRKSLLVK